MMFSSRSQLCCALAAAVALLSSDLTFGLMNRVPRPKPGSRLMQKQQQHEKKIRPRDISMYEMMGDAEQRVAPSEEESESENDNFVSTSVAIDDGGKNIPGIDQEPQSLSEAASRISEKVSSNKLSLLAFYAANLATVSGAAKFGLLNGPALADGTVAPYADALIAQDAGASIGAIALAVIFVKAIGMLNENLGVSTTVTRKLVHTLVAPLFMLVWPLFSGADGARFFAGCVSLTNLLRLYWAGKNPKSSLARSVSRSGDTSEALEGPFVYVCIIHLVIWTFWRSSPIGVVALTTMAAGDGMADLVGRKWGKNSQWDKTVGWDFAKGKSIVGTTAFAVAASIASIGLLAWLSTWGCLALPAALSWTGIAVRVVGISTACAFIELLPVGDDNYTVPISAALLAAWLLT